MWSFVRACTYYGTFANCEVSVSHLVCQKDLLCLCARWAYVCEDCASEGYHRSGSSTSCLKQWALQVTHTHKIPWRNHFSGFLATVHTVLGGLFRVALNIPLSLTRSSVDSHSSLGPRLSKLLTCFIDHSWRWSVAVPVHSTVLRRSLSVPQH